MTRFLRSRPQIGQQEPLSATEEGKSMSRAWFASRLCFLCKSYGLSPERYTAHRSNNRSIHRTCVYTQGKDTQSVQDEEGHEGELLCLKIKTQLEDLLSDRHLATDGFLLKHVQKSKQGYVSLKLLTCLKKIKVLTTNWYMTLAGAKCSELLEVNDESTKVRRREPLPKWLLCSPTSKLLLACNISVEKTTGEDGAAQALHLEERILQKFSAHGSISSVWILHPDKELPKELQCYAKHHKELGQQLCAVVKFDHLEEVRKAYNALKAEEERSEGEGMRVVPLGNQSMHHITKDEPSEKNNGDQPEHKPSQERPLETSGDTVLEKPSLAVKVSDETPDTPLSQKSSDNSMQNPSDQTSTSFKSDSFSGLNQRDSKESRWCSGDYGESPWVLRRKFAASVRNPMGARYVNTSFLTQRVLRQPFGPDGTKGFRSRVKLLLQEELKPSLGSGSTTSEK